MMASELFKPFQNLYKKAEILEEQFFDRSLQLVDAVLNTQKNLDSLQFNSSQVKTMHTLEVTMLGPTGVGKTSLMAAMYDQFAKNVGEANLQLLPDQKSEAKLQKRLVELKGLTNSFKADTGGVQGNISEVCHSFELGLQGKQASLQLKFWDYPGDYHDQSSTSKGEFLRDRLTNAAAIMVAIHAPALMEKNGQFHELMNNPTQVTNLFRRFYKDIDSPRLVILTPVKCEKYLQSSYSGQNLLARVKEEYKELLGFLASPDLQRNVSVVITPVQTVGSVIFYRMEQLEGLAMPAFYFRKIGHSAKYSPQDTEQPLRYLLRFALKLHLDQRQWKRFDFLRRWFQSDEHLIEAVSIFSKGCKDSGEFQVIQGHDLLTIGES